MDEERTSVGDPHHLHTRTEPVEPGKIDEYVVRLYPFAATFNVGHRLVAELSNVEPLVDEHNSLPIPKHSSCSVRTRRSSPPSSPRFSASRPRSRSSPAASPMRSTSTESSCLPAPRQRYSSGPAITTPGPTRTPRRSTRSAIRSTTCHPGE
ncbi:MAG: hypothetical protein L0L36_06360 [Brevibacterium sp.]|nr:hypothetical protein [Brevibacterium sp.]